MVTWYRLSKMNLSYTTFKFNRIKLIQCKYNQYSKSKQRDIFLDTVKTQLIDCNWFITPNRFPYALEKNITHSILWLPYEQSLPVRKIYTMLFEYYKTQNKQIILIHNRIENMSVKSIDHWQMFTRENTHKSTSND